MNQARLSEVERFDSKRTPSLTVGDQR